LRITIPLYPTETPIAIKSPVIEKRRTRDLPQINERIRFPKIRVIDTDGEQLGILTPQEAQQMAEEKDLDLVLVSDKADPPVCRIMDYGKYKFELEKRAREAKKKQHTSELKEVKMRYTIEEHDYQVRVSQADRKQLLLFAGGRSNIAISPKKCSNAWQTISRKLPKFSNFLKKKVGI
jgi:translation initiation factor IF-3